MDKKSYGLVLPKKKNDPPKLKAKSIFESDSDEDSHKLNEKRKAPAKLSKVEAKHIEEDPSIYEYDSIYDSMKQSSETKKQSVVIDRKPRFMSSLLKAADKRKKDQERRAEKKIHKERQNEGDEFQDKEAFVTSAYKNKMLEMEAEEEKERRKEKLDEMMDVTKQKDLSGFYRHLLNQTTGEEKVPEFGETDKAIGNQASKAVAIKTENTPEQDSTDSSEEDIGAHKGKKQIRGDEKISVTASSQKADSERLKVHSSKKKMFPEQPTSPVESHSKPQRKRNDSESSDESLEKLDHEKGGLKRKLSAEDDQNTNKNVSRKGSLNEIVKQDQLEKEAKDSSKIIHPSTGDDSNVDADEDIVESDSEKSDKDEVKDEQITDGNGVKSNISLKFIKRTVSEVFEQAQERYFKRLAARDSLKKP